MFWLIFYGGGKKDLLVVFFINNITHFMLMRILNGALTHFAGLVDIGSDRPSVILNLKL